MDNQQKYKSYLTFEYSFYNHHQGRNQDKIVKMYSEEGKGAEKKIFFPPTISDVYGQKHGEKLTPKTFERTLGDFAIQEASEETRERLKKNIERQTKVLNVVKRRNEEFNYNCGVVKAGTGVGKTMIAMKIIEYFGCNTLFLVPNVIELKKTIQKFKEFTGVDIAQYGDGKKDVWNITVCTKTSFALDHEKICKDMNFQTIIVDECHKGFSDKLRFAINKSFDCVNLYGMSATPFTPILEQKQIEKYFGAVIDVMDGYDYQPDFEIINYQPEKICIEGVESDEYIYESYPELRGMMAEDMIRFEKQIEKLRELYKKRNCILVLTDRVVESENFNERLSGSQKFNIIKITGETDTDDDQAQLKAALENGKKTIIVGSIQKIGTGFDYPSIDTVFLVSAIKWKSTTEQAIGRALRKHDKLNPLVVIWNDECLKGQRAEKLKTIKRVYGVEKKDIVFTNEGDHRAPHEKIKLSFTDITQTK